MIPVKHNELNENVLQTLCDEATSESLTLEFKRELPGKELDHKGEFLKDVSAMANADGGDIVYGIEEKGGVAFKILPLQIITTDAEERRLGQILDAGIEPRITGVRFKWVPTSKGHTLVLRVPKSYDAPHRVTISNPKFDEKFFVRGGTHISTMRYEQLKTSFDKASTLTERAKSFRQQRLNLIKNNNTPKPLIPGPLCVVHVIPLASATGKQVVDVLKLSNEDPGKIMFLSWSHNTVSFNLDGIVAHLSMNEPGYGYNQIFRYGCTESVFVGGSLSRPTEKIIHSTTITTELRNAVWRNITLLKDFSVSGPIVIGVSMLSVEGYTFGVGGAWEVFGKSVADRDDLIFPEVWLESVDLISNVDEVMRPLLDMLWQSFGRERCFEYSENGDWTPRGH